jgi:RND family efflux transporter MFP subunit
MPRDWISPQWSGRILVTLVLSELALAGGYGIKYGLTLLKQAPEVRETVVRKYNVEIFTAAPVDVREIVGAFGTARADKDVTLSAQVAGEVVGLHPHFKVGTRVHAASDANDDGPPNPGELLVRIDSRTYSEHVTQAKHRLAQDEIELEGIDQEERNLDRLSQRLKADHDDAQRELTKIQGLRDKGINTDSDLRRAQMELRSHDKLMVQNGNERDLIPNRRDRIRKQIETHQNDLQIAELDLSRTTIRPPFESFISSVKVELGQYVRIGDPLISLIDPSIVEIPLSVTLEDYGKILPDVRERNYPAVGLAEHETAPVRWKGQVVRVAPQADEHTRTAMVYVQVDNMVQPTPLLPGSFVHARIDGPLLKQALLIPRDAISNSGRVFVEKNGSAAAKKVLVARKLQGLAVIDSGIESGDRVILTNLDVMYDGASVTADIQRSLQDELGSVSSVEKVTY